MNKTKLIFTVSIGTFFEHFDFYLFSLFALALNYSFFGSVNKHSVLWIFLIFAIGYLARISGALIFGYWGDKIGRLYSFKKTVVIMAISSIVIGFLPSYSVVGYAAVIGLMLMRFIQGISYGGEEAGATIIVIERYKNHQPLLILILSFMGTLGVLSAKGTYILLGQYLNHQQMMDYGWRIAYILGGILIFHSYFARKEIAESSEFNLSRRNQSYKNTVKGMFSDYKVLLILGTLTLCGIQLFWGVFMIYLPNYISLKSGSSQASNMTYYIILTGSLLGNIIGAFIANKTNTRVVYSIGSIICFLLSFPLYIALHLHKLDDFYILLLFIAIAEGTTGVFTILVLAKRFPINYRYTLAAASVAFAAFLFIGLPPFFFSLFTRENSMYYPILIFTIGWLIQIVSVQLFYKKTAKFVESEKTIMDGADYQYA